MVGEPKTDQFLSNPLELLHPMLAVGLLEMKSLFSLLDFSFS